jgi:hypothetical protein
MTAAGVARQVLGEFVVSKERHVFRNRCRPCLKHTHAGAIELLQRPAANAANHNGIDPMPVKTRHRVAGTMLMDAIAVVYRGQFVRGRINHDKTWR